jgi:predicted ATPase
MLQVPERAPRVLCVCGAAGVGKTALLAAFAARTELPLVFCAGLGEAVRQD